MRLFAGCLWHMFLLAYVITGSVTSCLLCYCLRDCWFVVCGLFIRLLCCVGCACLFVVLSVVFLHVVEFVVLSSTRHVADVSMAACLLCSLCFCVFCVLWCCTCCVVTALHTSDRSRSNSCTVHRLSYLL